jgi:ATP-dependent Zn protease
MSEQSRVAALLGESRLLRAGQADVARIQRRTHLRRMFRAIFIIGALDAYLWYRSAVGRPVQLPAFSPDWSLLLPILLLFVIVGALVLMPLASGRSPHVMIRPEHIDVALEDVKGLGPQVDEVIRTLNIFLGYATFRKVLGGNPRRGVLFEGPPGTGKTYLAKAMAKQAGVPFLYASAPAFQTMWFGMTNVKIRSYFRALRRAARREGGAIGFIEEIDAIGGDRGSAVAMSPAPVGSSSAPGRLGSRIASAFGSAPAGAGMVNELLIQMQSFDQPQLLQRTWEHVAQWVNGYLPDRLRIRAGHPKYYNVLLVAATNRADTLDPALLRPGRFDRRLYFDLPTKQGRRDLIDFFLERKSHTADLDGDEPRERLAHDTLGYTPVMIEHVLDEALLLGLRAGRDEMNVTDVYEAKLTEEVGLSQPVFYTEEERSAVATHEAGHAVVAYVLGTSRRMEVLSIIKRRASLGLLAHTDLEERFSKSRSELEALLAIALGGMVAEELFLGESGTGPGADLSQATVVAAMMVGALGMGGSLASYDAMHDGFAPRNLVAKVMGDPPAKERLEALLETQKDRVRTVLSENRHLLEALRDALLARDELIGDEILEVIHAAKPGDDR